jgi:hypothetical protein
MAIVGALIEISSGNERNHHIYLREAQFLFPASVIGGSNEEDSAEEELTVQFVPGSTIKTDIAGDKMILRNRSATKEFFAKASVVAGDRIVVERIDRTTFRISKFVAGSSH